MSVEILQSEKVKMEKSNSKKAAAKSKGKVTLRTEHDVSQTNRFVDYPLKLCIFQDIDGYQKYGNDFTDDYDDFM